MKNKVCLAVAVLGLSIAGCGEEKASAPSASPATTAAVAAPAASGLPAECEAYFKTVTACVEKVGASNPAVVATFKAQMDQNRAAWAKVQNKATLGPACKQIDDSFKSQTAPAMKC